MAIEIFGKSMSEEDFARELKKRKAEMDKDLLVKTMAVRARGFGKTSTMIDELSKVQDKYNEQMFHYQKLMAKVNSDMDSILGLIPPKPVTLEGESFKWIDMGDEKKIPDIITSKEKLTPAEIGERYGRGLLEQLEGQKQEYEKLTMKHLEDIIKDLSSTRKKFPMTPAEAFSMGDEVPVSPILGIELPQMDDVALEHLHKGVMEEIDIPSDEKSILLSHIAAERSRRGSTPTWKSKTKRGKSGMVTFEEAGKVFVADEFMKDAMDKFQNKMEMNMIYGDPGKRVGDGQDFILHTGAAGHKAFDDAMKMHHISTKGMQLKNPSSVFHMEPFSVGDEDKAKKIEVKVKSSTPVVPNLGGSLRQTRAQKLYDKIKKSLKSEENRYEL